ncbi:GPI mannosyltransferase 2 [Calycina marina]|uniref:GPI mannosyltransferase 2 n=1 Tax=Calycina marina TaxID=1763456 RepID=A0A9P8CEE3_9HELO|nr:GPI mannosyltransferase 2 [Calycina marina]
MAAHLPTALSIVTRARIQLRYFSHRVLLLSSTSSSSTTMPSRIVAPQDPTRSLLLAFVAWKALLLLVALCSPGPGYDTSTTLSLSSHSEEARRLPAFLHHTVSKLTRWDAIYFVKSANRGYLFEQEWAFGWGFSKLIALVSSIIQKVGFDYYEGLEGLVGICIAHGSHLASVVVLYHLTLAMFPGNPARAATTAAFHIISPAGLFLSAPYAESSCALLSFLGFLMFRKSLGSQGKQSSAAKDLLVVSAGVCFGIANTFRSNAILNGLLLLEEAFRTLFLLRHGIRFPVVRRLAATGLGGLIVGFGFLLPQYIAFTDFCNYTSGPRRGWCERPLPSIYIFVQDEYWNCGPFRYWILPNMPLFLLATPMFLVMFKSGTWVVRYGYLPVSAPVIQMEKTPSRKLVSEESSISAPSTQVLRNLALSQLLLSTLTLVTAHVQIITRISSAYPVWVWYLASSRGAASSTLTKNSVIFMVVYGLVQGGLFASFLPPA